MGKLFWVVKVSLQFGNGRMRFIRRRPGFVFGTSFCRFRRTILEGTCFLGARRWSLETLSRVRRHEVFFFLKAAAFRIRRL
jgi:hypothetical protein